MGSRCVAKTHKCPRCGVPTRSAGWLRGSEWCGRRECVDEEDRLLRVRLAEIKAGKRSPVPPTLATLCQGCGDTNKILNDPQPAKRSGDAPPWPVYLPCPICPAPCSACAGATWSGSDQEGILASAGRGAYCRRSPCSCRCHLGAKAPTRRAKAAGSRGTRATPFLPTDPRGYAEVPDQITAWREVIRLSHTFAWRWDPIDLEIRSVLVRQDGTAAIEVSCPSLTERAIGNGFHPGVWEIGIGIGPHHPFDVDGLPKAVRLAVLCVTEHAILAQTGRARGLVAEAIKADATHEGVTRGWRLDQERSAE